MTCAALNSMGAMPCLLYLVLEDVTINPCIKLRIPVSRSSRLGIKGAGREAILQF